MAPARDQYGPRLISGLLRCRITKACRVLTVGCCGQVICTNAGRSAGSTSSTVIVSWALRVIWESLDHVCAERLTPALVATAEQLARHGELSVTDDGSGVPDPPYIDLVYRFIRGRTYLSRPIRRGDRLCPSRCRRRLDPACVRL